MIFRVVLLAFLGVLASASVQAQQVSPDEARATAKEAYVYAYAMLDNYQTLHKQVVDDKATEYVGGFGRFRHYAQVFTPENRDIVTPNNDTPYSWAWLDLRAEPWVVSVPAVPDGRYYVMQWFDLFTHNFAYMGSRTTGNEAGNYLFVGPRWNGTVPEGIRQVFRAETEIIGTLTRTALNGPEDVPNVRAVQRGYRLQPLSEFAATRPPRPSPAIDYPSYDARKARSKDFIGYLNFLLQFSQPPHPSEVELMRRFARIGIGPGHRWDAAKLDPVLLEAIKAGASDGEAAIRHAATTSLDSSTLFGTREYLANDYVRRSVGAQKGIYGNSREEAWYGGFVGDGTKLSKMHFAPGQLPPAQFFWSLTLYTLPDRLLYANPQQRYSLGDRSKGLVYGADGSLTIYLGHQSPGPTHEANWIPAPNGRYSLVARVYGPKQNLLSGQWKLPTPEPVAAAEPR
ncbi:MAG: DUF1254 domain-containing protein [Methylorubrum extorquens]|jgi:hypothetical protein|uniref:DUF1254 domain-containing protein n=1 Tax=Methylorubrum extorquens TaxID=408 RepID=UPI002FEE3061